jgi:hypothetical protein
MVAGNGMRKIGPEKDEAPAVIVVEESPIVGGTGIVYRVPDVGIVLKFAQAGQDAALTREATIYEALSGSGIGCISAYYG